MPKRLKCEWEPKSHSASMPTVLVPGIPISLRMLLAGLITTPIPLSLSAATVGRSALATIPLASLSVSKPVRSSAGSN